MHSWKDSVITDYSKLKGKRVLVRLDWNLPVDEGGTITDTSRADATFPFLKSLSFAGARLVLLTHFGDKGESAAPIFSYIKDHIPFAHFNPSLSFDDLSRDVASLAEGEAVLLENVRRWDGETDNLPSLARSFASMADVFINNAFSVSHREHTSVVGIPHFVFSYFGPLFARELEHLEGALHPTKPALMIVGGAKIKTKLSLIQTYLDRGVRVFVGGAMVHDIWKAKGVEIGQSVHDGTISLPESFLNHPLLMTPEDVVLATGQTVKHYAIPRDGMVVDCGQETIQLLSQEIANSKTVIANGPLGLYEKGWRKGSEDLLTALAHSGAVSYIGGGDTVAVAHSLHLLQKFTFVSLGGGAMLEYLQSGTLPGIHAVTEWKPSGYR